MGEVLCCWRLEIDGDGGEMVSRWYPRGDGAGGQQCQGSKVDKDDKVHISKEGELWNDELKDKKE